MAKDLRSYLKQLVTKYPDSVKVVDKEVDPRFGITAYASRLAESGEFPGLIFNQVKGSELSCISNVLTSYERIALYLDCEVQDIPRVYGEKLKNPIAPTIVERS